MHYAGLGGSSVATWTADVTPGQYAVDVTWYADPNRATNAPFTVLDGNVSRGTTLINQRQSPAGSLDQGVTWQTLGTYTLTGNRLVVQLSNNANGYVIADAIRIRPVTNLSASPAGTDASEADLAVTTEQNRHQLRLVQGRSPAVHAEDPRHSASFWELLIAELAAEKRTRQRHDASKTF
jgi:hypothetical protein